jgi:hypothetical protein
VKSISQATEIERNSRSYGKGAAMMPRLSFVVIAVAMLIGQDAEAAKFLPEGAPRFGIDLSSADLRNASGCWTIAVSVHSARHPADALGAVDIQITGARATAGMTHGVVHPSANSKPADRHWLITLCKEDTGRVEVKARVRITNPGPDSYDLSESVMLLHCGRDSVSLLENGPTVRVGVREGKRFRYGGEYLVAIDGTELEGPKEINRRPVPISTPNIMCSGCSLEDTLDVEVVVTVGQDGSVTWIRDAPLGETPIAEEVWNAITSGLRGYRFVPASSGGRAVADYAIVGVRVIPSQ